MKILTLNSFSWMSENPQEKLEQLANAIFEERFDVIAMQEVNQSIGADEVSSQKLLESAFVSTENETIKVKEDNYALALVEKLNERGLKYSWTYTPNHIGYDKFDEGVAILSAHEIVDVKDFYISKARKHTDIKTRKILGANISIDGNKKWFFSIHMGWWNDQTDPFKDQWNTLQDKLQVYQDQEIYLMGDFNVPYEVRNQGYDLITSDNKWFDTHSIAKSSDSGKTVIKKIDGWRESNADPSMKIDYIFKNRSSNIISSKVIFDGKKYPVVSDHFGLYITE